MGQVLVAEKKWDEAEEFLLKALELKPDSTSVYNLLVDSYVAGGNEPKAIAQLEKLLELQPENFQRRMTLAMLTSRTAISRRPSRTTANCWKGSPNLCPH